MRKLIPYPLRAARISISINPFGFWWKPEFRHNKKMPERYRQDGMVIWWARFAWFHISYSRWL